MTDKRDTWIAEANVKPAAEAEGSVSTSIAAAMLHLTEAKSKLRGEL